MVKFDIEDAWAGLPIPRIHPPVAQESNIQWFPATSQNTGWMKYRQARHGSAEAIPVQNAVDVEKAYGYSASHYYCIKWRVWSYGWRYVYFGQEDDSMEGKLILCREVCGPEAVQIIYWSYSYEGYASHLSTYPWSVSEVAIIQEVGQGKDINPEDETSYTTQYQEVFLKYVENEYCAKHRRLLVTKPKSVPCDSFFYPAMDSRSGH